MKTRTPIGATERGVSVAEGKKSTGAGTPVLGVGLRRFMAAYGGSVERSCLDALSAAEAIDTPKPGQRSPGGFRLLVAPLSGKGVHFAGC